MALCTTAEFKTWRGVTGSDWDTAIGVLIASSQAEIERLCGRTAGGFESASFTEVFDGDGSQTLRVSNGPISSITSITVGNSDPVTLSADSYTFKDRTISRIPFNNPGAFVNRSGWGDILPIASRSPCFDEGVQNVTVVYTGGYATVPDDLKQVCYEFVAHQLDSRGQDFGKQAAAVGNTNYTYRSPADFKEYKLMLVSPWRSLR